MLTGAISSEDSQGYSVEILDTTVYIHINQDKWIGLSERLTAPLYGFVNITTVWGRANGAKGLGGHFSDHPNGPGKLPPYVYILWLPLYRTNLPVQISLMH